MEKTPETAVLELKQIAPVLRQLLGNLSVTSKRNDPTIYRVLSSSTRIRQLSNIVFGSNETFDLFIGNCVLDENNASSSIFSQASEHLRTLISFVESVVDNFKTDDRLRQLSEENSALRLQIQSFESQQKSNQLIMVRLTKENDSFEKQLDELRQNKSELDEKVKNLSILNSSLQKLVSELQQRENTYISVIKVKDNKKGFDSESKDILLASCRRQKSILLRNLTVFQETKAKHGLNIPIEIVHSIEETEKELEQIESKIANLESN